MYLKINNHGIIKTQLSNELKMHPNTIKKYLETIQEHGIIIKEKKRFN